MVCIGNDLHFNGCFLETDRLHLESSLPLSLYKIIRFTLNKDSTRPCSVQGRIKFANDETTEELLVVGAQKVEFVLAPRAWE